MTSSFRTEQVGKHTERRWTIYTSKIGIAPYHLPETLLCDFITASDSKEKKNKWSDTEIALTKIILSLHSQEMKKKIERRKSTKCWGREPNVLYVLGNLILTMNLARRLPEWARGWGESSDKKVLIRKWPCIISSYISPLRSGIWWNKAQFPKSQILFLLSSVKLLSLLFHVFWLSFISPFFFSILL